MSAEHAPTDAVPAALPRVAETLEETAASDETPETIDSGEMFDLVSSRRRRETILLLADHQQGVDQPRMNIGEMTDYIAGVMSDDPTDIPEHEISSSRSLLYQHHLPRLEELGLVAIERPDEPDESWVIEPTEDLTPIADAIRTVEGVCARYERATAEADA